MSTDDSALAMALEGLRLLEVQSASLRAEVVALTVAQTPEERLAQAKADADEAKADADEAKACADKAAAWAEQVSRDTEKAIQLLVLEIAAVKHALLHGLPRKTIGSLIENTPLSNRILLPDWGGHTREGDCSANVNPNCFPLDIKRLTKWKLCDFIALLRRADDFKLDHGTEPQSDETKQATVIEMMRELVPIGPYVVSCCEGNGIADVTDIDANKAVKRESTVTDILKNVLFACLRRVFAQVDKSFVLSASLQTEWMEGASPAMTKLFEPDMPVFLKQRMHHALVFVEVKRPVVCPVKKYVEIPSELDLSAVGDAFKMRWNECGTEANKNIADERKLALLNSVLEGHFYDLVHSNLPVVSNFNPVRQILNYMFAFLTRIGSISTFNKTSFLYLDGVSTDYTVMISPKLSATSTKPLHEWAINEEESVDDVPEWSWWEIWIRVLICAMQVGKFNALPDMHEEFLRKPAETLKKSALNNEINELDKPLTGASQLCTSTSGNIQTASRNVQSALGGRVAENEAASGGAMLPPFDPLSYADLWDDRRFGRVSAPPEIVNASYALEGDALEIAEGRWGTVYRKNLQGRDVVVKMLVLGMKLNNSNETYTDDFLCEWRRERDVYDRLIELQGISVPELFWGGALIQDKALAIATKYCGTSFEALESISPVQAKSALDALQSIHDKGIGHGNVSLCNVLWDDIDGGRARVIDFGMSTYREDYENESAWESMLSEERISLEHQM